MVRLKRDISLIEAILYGLCVIIGAGIYVLIGVAAGEAGNGTWVSFILAALIAGCTGLSYAELSSKLPYDSAEYIYSLEAFKSRRLAFAIGWFKLITAIIAGAVVSLGFGGYFAKLFGVSPLIGALIIAIISLIMNLLSVRNTIVLSGIFVIITIIGLLMIIFSSAGYFGSINYFDFTFGWHGIFSAAALIFFAFLGFEDIVALGEEAKEPRKILPKAILFSILISTILYTLVSLAAISVIPWQELAKSASPLSLIAETTMGAWGAWFITIIALVATGSTVFGLFFAYSRMIYGMAERGSLPCVFLKLSKKRKVPYVALIAVGLITIAFILMQNLRFIVEVTDFGALFVFMTVNLSLIVLRYRHVHLPGQFKVPINIGKFPVIAAIGVLFCLYMLTKLGFEVVIISAVLFAIGIFLFNAFVCKQKQPYGKV
jgi:APA family basic amino acid/polyamine antiporter